MRSILNKNDILLFHKENMPMLCSHGQLTSGFSLRSSLKIFYLDWSIEYFFLSQVYWWFKKDVLDYTPHSRFWLVERHRDWRIIMVIHNSLSIFRSRLVSFFWQVYGRFEISFWLTFLINSDYKKRSCIVELL